ncbi:hypothetical protein GCM10023318_13290 [Nocardia callitridis]|uniref:Uncharacterized protein n=1 Tax=Nocardia callitridis TaxID=648753 RepID=A0ABP9K102_9NOCA
MVQARSCANNQPLKWSLASLDVRLEATDPGTVDPECTSHLRLADPLTDPNADQVVQQAATRLRQPHRVLNMAGTGEVE